MDLLSPQDRAEFRAAMADIRDTFYKTPIQYGVRVTASRNRFGENVRPSTDFDTHNLMARIQYSMLVQNEYVWQDEGSDPNARVKVTLNVDSLDAEGLWDSTNHVALVNGIDDCLTFQGREYRIISPIAYGGYLEEKPVMAVLYAEPKIIKTV